MCSLTDFVSIQLNEKIITTRPLSGGDISSAYLLQTESKKYFLKINSKAFAREMFQAEQRGLQAIEKTKTIAVPGVQLVDSFEGISFLLMDFVESKRADLTDYERFGRELAQLHFNTHHAFGFSSDNFIGSLTQANTPHQNWAAFYWYERISPQLNLATKAGLLNKSMIPDEEKAIKTFSDVFGDVKPALLHGDLWSGNYLIAANGTPYLIDPAVYFGHSVVDIAMSKLFGGFSQSFYDAYHEIIPKAENHSRQIELYQLYYLLVHLNLFGSGYYSSVASILRKYF